MLDGTTVYKQAENIEACRRSFEALEINTRPNVGDIRFGITFFTNRWFHEDEMLETSPG